MYKEPTGGEEMNNMPEIQPQLEELPEIQKKKETDPEIIRGALETYFPEESGKNKRKNDHGDTLN